MGRRITYVNNDINKHVVMQVSFRSRFRTGVLMG